MHTTSNVLETILYLNIYFFNILLRPSARESMTEEELGVKARAAPARESRSCLGRAFDWIHLRHEFHPTAASRLHVVSEIS